ncbi:hypothetical protein [Ornithinimicrobium kibberense]|uniref:hypothetical protein n=1 Tax=Ornithinimicrobium kibberense TaxID=282060 RepID=UPI00360AAA76
MAAGPRRGAHGPDRVGGDRGGRPGGRLDGRAGARARPAPEDARAAPVPDPDDPRCRRRRPVPPRGRRAHPCRRAGAPREQDGHLDGAAGPRAGRGALGLEELLRRGRPGAVHPGGDDAGRADPRLHLLPVAVE